MRASSLQTRHHMTALMQPPLISQTGSLMLKPNALSSRAALNERSFAFLPAMRAATSLTLLRHPHHLLASDARCNLDTTSPPPPSEWMSPLSSSVVSVNHHFLSHTLNTLIPCLPTLFSWHPALRKMAALDTETLQPMPLHPLSSPCPGLKTLTVPPAVPTPFLIRKRSPFARTKRSDFTALKCFKSSPPCPTSRCV